MLQDRAIRTNTIADWWEFVHDLSNDAIFNDLEWPINHNSTFRPDISETIKVEPWLLQTTVCCLLNCTIVNDLGRPSQSFQLFLSNKCRLLFHSLIESPGDLTSMTLPMTLSDQSLSVLSVYQKYSICNVRSQLQRSDVIYNYFSAVFDRKDCYVILECDLLAIAKFLVIFCYSFSYKLYSPIVPGN